MLGIEFGKPSSIGLRTAWTRLEKANVSLFSQMILIPLFSDHRILAQVSSHGRLVIKLLPPLVICARGVEWTVGAFDKTIGDCHQVTGAIWDLGRRLATHAMAQPRAANG